jgi:Secretion system C-terminal sorting domain/Common central domain of tyrosinase
MKQIAFTLALCLGTLFLCNNVSAQCPGVRRDLNTLSTAETVELRDAIMEFLRNGTDPLELNVVPNDYPAVAHHFEHLNLVHNTGTVAFVTWHRWFIQTLETWMLENGHENLVPIPAWNPNNPIPAAFFDNNLAKLPTLHGFPDLQNDVLPNFNFSSLTGAGKCASYPNPNNFSSVLEGKHGNVHNGIGGTMANVGLSPGAAIFWPWHAWVDDVWYCYQKDCKNKVSDLYVRDDEDDDGTEPSISPINWVSPDIWVRQTSDGFANQVSEDLHQTPGAVAYVYVRVQNHGDGRHPNGQGNLDVFWANASAGLDWPSPWDGVAINGLCQPPNADLPLGGFVGTQPLRSINEDFIDFTHLNDVVKDYTIYEYAWTLPDPDKYKSCFNDDEWQHRHFCILARIEGDDAKPIIDFDDFAVLLRNNNDVALRNITIFGDGQTAGLNATECLFYGNYSDQAMNDVKLRITFPTTGDQQLLQKAQIRMMPDVATLQKWAQHGALGTNVAYEGNTGAIRFNAQNAEIRGIALNPQEIHRFCLRLNQLQPITQPYTFDVIQYNGNKMINGERYIVGGNAGVDGRSAIITKAADLGFAVFPNPATESMTVTWGNEVDNYSIRLTDNTGRLVYETTGLGGSSKINVSNFPKGFYFLELLNLNTKESSTQKVVIED